MAVARFFLDKGADPNKQAQDGLFLSMKLQEKVSLSARV
jgi:hypothetical protein